MKENLTDIAHRIFAADRYATELTGIVIDSVDDHTAVCLLTLGEPHRNARGVAMGGVLFTLADFAAAVAANTVEADTATLPPTLHWVSLNASIHYLAPAVGQHLRAVCSPLKTGRTTALYQTVVTDPDSGRTVAIVDTTMMHM